MNQFTINNPMEAKELLKFCLENGVLLDRDVLALFNDVNDIESVKMIINKIKNHTHQKIITKNLFFNNKEKVIQFFSTLPRENQIKLEKLKINLGLSIEISKEVSTGVFAEQSEVTSILKEKETATLQDFFPSSVKVLSTPLACEKKIEVSDFVGYFRNRYSETKQLLQSRVELDNLVSINKISGVKQGVSIIGMISDKKITKNKNILFDVEDLTGKIRLLVNHGKKEVFEKAEEIPLDSVVGFKCSGDREILFVNDIVFLDSFLPTKKKSPKEEYALFVGDIHYGSKYFMEDKFLKFIDYINGKVPNTPEVENIKYLFLNGDLVAGVGNYPNQERELKIADLEEQFSSLAEVLKKIRKDITLIISPGNHDGVRIMEPQPMMDEKYAWPLYSLKNAVFIPNPGEVNIGAFGEFSGLNVLTYHGFSFYYYANNVPSLMKAKALNCPEKIMDYLLKHRHLAPTHGSAQYFPCGKDFHFIKNVPDIVVSAHTHKSGVSYYNNILTLSVSTWEALTPYMEKSGSKPDFCKVPMLNLKTRAIKILDFE